MADDMQCFHRDDMGDMWEEDLTGGETDIRIPFLPRITFADKNDAVIVMVGLIRYFDHVRKEYGDTSPYLADLQSLLDATTLEVQRLRETELLREDGYNG